MSTYPSGNPARMGRRVWARVLDSVTLVALTIGIQAFALVAMASGASELLLLSFGLMVAWLVFAVWALIARAALPGQWLLGLHHVDAVSGQRAGGKTFLKYLVQGCTFGLALVMTPLTIQAPNRSCFDRLAGVTLIDPKEPDPGGGELAQVTAPPAGWHAEESQLTQLEQAAAQDPAVTGDMIQSVPFEASRSQAPVTTPPAVERPAPLVVEPPLTPVRAVAAVVSAPAPMPVATLDTGEVVSVTGTIIIGRAPRQSESLGAAALVAVSDRSISANHLALGVGPAGPWVMDLKSTNGSWVEQDGAAAAPLEPMAAVQLSPGAVVGFGQRRFTVSAR